MTPLPDRNMSSTPPLPPYACLIACLPDFGRKRNVEKPSGAWNIPY